MDDTLNLRSKLEKGTRLHQVHWVIIFLSLLLTFGAWYFSSQQLLQKNKTKFDREAEHIISLVKERMQLYENALWGGAALIDSNSSQITYDQWKAYAGSLNIDQAYPGINGIGVIYNVKPEDFDNYLIKERAKRPHYTVHPTHNKKEYWPITYIEPEIPNKEAVGLDMAFENNRYTAIKRARNEGTAQVTGPIALVQDAKKTPGFLFYTPVYKSAGIPETIGKRQDSILGVTYAPFIMNKLMKGTLAQGNRHVRVKISDEGTLLYNDSLSESTIDTTPLFTTSSSIEMYGRNWIFDIETDLNFRKATDSDQPYIILIGGLIIDSILLGLFLFLTRMNKLALNYADKMNQELEEKNIHLEQANKLKSEFLSVASHELRTPLTSIKGALGIVKQFSHQLPQETQNILDIAHNNSERLSHLVNDILDVEKLTNDKITFDITSIEVDKFIGDIAKNQSIYCKTHHSNIIFDANAKGVKINSDKGRLDQVITNLLSNAAKFSPKNSDIIIRTQAKDKKLRIDVIDQGPGIPDDFKEKIFQRFSQADTSSTRSAQGAGLGLYICKKIITNLGGRINFESNTAKGSVFYIEFDL
ncbi:CHASE domain-containing sensor histidine kinase [Kistimonas asteriae]|uniref:CHASE domain-containing sensor histidine kinase n=1 Tax=Kistimonas asteriae TaxID=517724 RepID=UPI001BA5C6EB|nr:CHASE domain-containing protein [Kistimonas asteriae]